MLLHGISDQPSYRRCLPDAQIDLGEHDLALTLLRLSCASSLNMGSIILHGGHITDVNIAMTAWCKLSKAWNNAKFVDAWITPVSGLGIAAAWAFVEGPGEL
jgi:hypothetical protein